MRNKKINFVLAFLNLFLLLLLVQPTKVFGVESAEIESQVGIHFENDYTPTSSGKEEIPGGKTTEKEIATSIKPTGGQSGKLLNAGEQITLGFSLIGLFLVGGVCVLFYYKRGKEQQKNRK